MLNYGDKVRVTTGEHAGAEGYIVMESRFGDVGVNITDKPDIGSYQLRIKPSELEVIATDDPFNIRRKSPELNGFETARLLMPYDLPEVVLREPTYFTREQIDRAVRNLQAKLDHPADYDDEEMECAREALAGWNNKPTV